MPTAVKVPYAPTGAATARERMTADMQRRSMPAESVEDARLILTEFVANALRHARPLPDGSVQVSWRFHRGRLEIRVTDGGSPDMPHVARFTEDSLGGRGLAIVSAIADDWGVSVDDETQTVWALLSVGEQSGTGARTRKTFAGTGAVSPN